MIKTSRGPKTPQQALELFKGRGLQAGELFGIYKQFEEPEATEAQEYVLASPEAFPEKLQRLAKEQATGIPIGPKVIRNAEDVKKFLEGLDVGTSVSITFAKDAASRMGSILTMAGIITLASYTRMLLTTCVIPSGRWSRIPRTCPALLQVRNEGDLKRCMECFPGVVESIEVNCTRKQFFAANDPCPKILADNPDLFFDEELFKATCAEMNRLSEANVWIAKLGTDPSMEKVLGVFSNFIDREEFLVTYVRLFNQALA